MKLLQHDHSTDGFAMVYEGHSLVCAQPSLPASLQLNSPQLLWFSFVPLDKRTWENTKPFLGLCPPQGVYTPQHCGTNSDLITAQPYQGSEIQLHKSSL